VTSLLLLGDGRHVAVGGSGGQLIVYHVDFNRWSVERVTAAPPNNAINGAN